MAEVEKKETQSDKYVTFKSGNEYFGIKIQFVNEIIVFQEITEIPESESYIKGLINLRGKIIPVIDVRIRFGQEPIPYTDRTCIIVLNIGDTVVGLIVERIAEVVEIPEQNIIPSPSIGKSEKYHNVFVQSIGKVGDSVKLLLDTDKLLCDDDIDVLENINKSTGEKDV